MLPTCACTPEGGYLTFDDSKQEELAVGEHIQRRRSGPEEEEQSPGMKH